MQKGIHKSWHHLWWETQVEEGHSDIVCPGQQCCGLSGSFLKFSSVAVRKWFTPFYKFSFWSFLSNPHVMPGFPCLGVFFFHLPFFHFEDSRARLSVLVSVTLYCAGVPEHCLNWPPGDVPYVKNHAASARWYKQLLCQFFSLCWHREWLRDPQKHNRVLLIVNGYLSGSKTRAYLSSAVAQADTGAAMELCDHNQLPISCSEWILAQGRIWTFYSCPASWMKPHCLHIKGVWWTAKNSNLYVKHVVHL